MYKLMVLPALLGLWLVIGGVARASYLDEDPDAVFAEVYQRLHITLPVAVARDPLIWIRLDTLRREACDQSSVVDLAASLEKASYRRQAAEALYNFVQSCDAPISALQTSVNILLKLSDYKRAVEVADDLVRRAPANRDARYLRGIALEGSGEMRRALADYADTIELFGNDKKKINSAVFLHMANAYAALGELCAAPAPIRTWIALDPATRDNSQTQKIINEYEERGHCAASMGSAACS